MRENLGDPDATLGPLTGKAGEYRVASELLLRGINVATYAIDNLGVDLITVPGNKRIQVKTSRKEYTDHGIKRPKKYPAYLFCVRKKKYVNSKNITLRPKIRPESIDFIICWCVDHDWFYIIPSKEMNQTQINIPIDQVRPSKYQQYFNAWEQLR